MGEWNTVTLPRFLLAAEGSGQGKTMVTCALLSLLSEGGFEPLAFKCGPDYIDPMFHQSLLGRPSCHLDSFFAEENMLKYLLGRHGESTEEKEKIAVIEGVMGYYDGLGGISERAGTYETAVLTDTPAVLLVDASGRSLSALAALKGFLSYRPDSRIGGVLFNRLSPSIYPVLKETAERELGIRVLGYIPALSDFSLKSRHLGLMMPEEIPDFREKIRAAAEKIRPCVDLEGLMALAREAKPVRFQSPSFPKLAEPVELAVARDKAFCFYYEENLELLRAMGARLRFFSPLKDSVLPAGVSGLYLGGGYPELYGRILSENSSMRESIRRAVGGGLPCIAECGGFLYLKEWLEDGDGNRWSMAGVLPGGSKNQGRLGRFGYIQVTARKAGLLGPEGTAFRAHEFHHWDSEENGSDFLAEKPLGNRSWDCGFTEKSLYAGFPHLYFYSNPSMAWNFLLKAAEWEAEHR